MTIGQYFNKYPKVTYQRPSDGSLKNSDGTPYTYTIEATDILVKYQFRDSILSNAQLLYPYAWQDGDSPESFAYKYYGSSAYNWVVFYSNGAMDRDYDFPMTQDQFNVFLTLKYGSVVATANSLTLAQYQAQPILTQIIQAVTYLNTVIATYQFYFTDQPSTIFNADINTYTYYSGSGYTAEIAAAALMGVSLPPAVTSTITLYEQEMNTNEAKRNINLIDNTYINSIVAEFTTDMNTLVSQQAAILGQFP